MLKNAEPNRARAPWILEQRHALLDQRQTIPGCAAAAKTMPPAARNHGPAESSAFVAAFALSDAEQHGQTAGDQDERHDRDIGNAVKRSGPIRSRVAYETVGHQAGGKRGWCRR